MLLLFMFCIFAYFVAPTILALIYATIVVLYEEYFMKRSISPIKTENNDDKK